MMKTAPTHNRVRSALAHAAASAAVFLCAVLLLAACSHEAPSATTRDDLGRAVALPPRIARVVTLAPNLTEILFAVGAGEKIVGTDDYSNFPASAKPLPKVGGMQPNIEKIAALEPDLVIASTEGNHPNLAPALAAAGIPLFVVRTDRLPEITIAMTRLGRMLGGTRTDAAVKMLTNDVARERRRRAQSPRVLFAVWTDPLFVGGRETFTDDVLRLTGAQNAVQVTGWPQYSLETLVATPPDLVVYPRGAVTPQQIAALQQRVPEMKAPVIAVDEDIFQRPGPRVADAAHRLNAILDAWERGAR
jgi:ABC-type Fe3+-hydroxamate transport system substrate-binding protein